MKKLLSLPLTGGWQSRQTLSVGQFDLAADAHDLRLDLINGGFNLNYVEFVEVAAAVGDEHRLPRPVALHQK